MKTIFTFCITGLLMFSLNTVFGQETCSDLMISEVVEGWSNNKAIEIYNPTPNPIDASEYGLVRFQNGNTEPGNITYLTGVVIQPFDVHVVVIDKRDPDGLDFEAPVWDELQLQADTFVNPQYNNGQEVMYFNGNDALALLTDGGQTLVDVFGKIGDSLNPDGWGAYVNSEGEQEYVSKDHTLIRKSTILEGYNSNPASFNILNEYDSLPANTFDMLGSHICACAPNSVNEIKKESSINIFPNPIADNEFHVQSKVAVVNMEILQPNGMVVLRRDINSELNVTVNAADLRKGFYIVRLFLDNGEIINKTIIR